MILNIYTRKPECNRVHSEYINRNKDVIFNEEMAVKIVELYLYREDAGILELHRDFEYDVEMEKSSQSIKEMEYDSQETKIVRIRKDNGMITVYNS